MSSSELVQPHHLSRKAVIYIRQSTRHQVLANRESQGLQRDMRERAIELGWPAERVEVVDADTGRTGTTTAGRDHYKNILTEVALGHVGIVLSYESARVSRNCSDWFPLLDLCAARQCLIADRDGVYDPGTSNGRFLLGMKGMVSEVELHALRGRLIAGIEKKANRGELALALPTGFIRLDDGRVVKDPNQQIQGAIDLVFKTFLEHRSACKVVRVFREGRILVPRRRYNDEIAWREAHVTAILDTLRNPAYAGAFAYGKSRAVHAITPDGQLKASQKKRPIEEWRVLVKDRYPSYISWEHFEEIQNIMRDNHAEYNRTHTRGVPREGAALLQGITYCGECGHKMGVTYRDGTHYICNRLRQEHQTPVCQFLPADAIDDHVAAAFFEALKPAELDVYQSAMQRRDDQQLQLDAAQKRELERLRYETDLARRQYNKVDPDNRLVASELERRWEAALRELRQAEERYEREMHHRSKIVPISISRDYRAAFESLGKSLPDLWRKPGALTNQQRKSLLRCLTDKVVLRRNEQRDHVAVRIVWRGGAVSETDVAVSVGRLRDVSRLAEMERQIVELARAGRFDEDISIILNQSGFRSARSTQLLPSTVKTIRIRHGIFRRYKGPRPRRVKGLLTLSQVAEAVGVTKHRLYYLIEKGVLQISRDKASGLYLFPDSPKTIQDIRRLNAGEINRVSY